MSNPIRPNPNGNPYDNKTPRGEVDPSNAESSTTPVEDSGFEHVSADDAREPGVNASSAASAPSQEASVQSPSVNEEQPNSSSNLRNSGDQPPQRPNGNLNPNVVDNNLESRVQILEAALNQLRTSNEQLSQEVGSLRRDLEAANARNVTLSQRVSELTQENNQLRAAAETPSAAEPNRATEQLAHYTNPQGSQDFWLCFAAFRRSFLGLFKGAK